MKATHVIMIDNFDSFTFNCVAALENLGAQVSVFRNQLPVEELSNILDNLNGYKCLILSPGPGHPKESGFCQDYVKAFAGKIPIFGICLGHQVLAQVFAGQVFHSLAKHGQSSKISHNGDPLFADIPSPFQAGRYHSLSVAAPKHFTVTATSEGLVMAMRHETMPLYGIQFHPESILTDYGDMIIKNMLTLTQQHGEKRHAA